MDSVKYLGVILSKDLSWTRYINSVCTDAKRRVGLLHRQFGLAGIPCLTQQNPHSPIPGLLFLCLGSVQDFATKVITQQWNSRYDDQLKLLILPRLSTSRKRQKLSLCYRIVTGQSIIPPSFFYTELLPISLPSLLVSFHSGIPFTLTFFHLLVVILSNLGSVLAMHLIHDHLPQECD